MLRLNSLTVVLLALTAVVVSVSAILDGDCLFDRCHLRPSYGGRRARCNPALWKVNPIPAAAKSLCSAANSTYPLSASSFGGLYGSWELHYNVIGSRYYFARMAEALEYNCPADRTLQINMQLMTPWSGVHGAIAVDSAYGFDRNILRRCDFPSGQYPFLCKGSDGNPPTCGERLGSLSYISVLHDNVNHQWTLFVHCWNPRRPEAPNCEPTAVSFNVFSTNKTMSADDIAAIKDKLEEYGFDTSDDNFVMPDFDAIPPPA